ncbi:LysM peptidoglycan-binding domain-containing protein [Leadbettera azotonutricia]|uniref:LysM peptidoglycan-binding domain-containing protein n=1 Tax=Leadbettera azotonutricia TaxID=150829 RepID=UPI0003006562|nr:LysM peptidoglycan-binding domain-containing protein [Leadbettera azotonutricia]
MPSTIGIKIANGEFYSIVEENSAVKKRLVLTTVHDKQRSVQIDLYKSFTKTMADALYIGSLVVENIKPKSKGEPSIEMVITSNKEGNITADAIDLDSSANGEHQFLNVSLKSMDEDDRDIEIPDFELEQNEAPPSGLYEKAQAAKEEEDHKGFPWLIVILIGLLLVAVLLFFLRGYLPGVSKAESSSSSRTTTQQPAAPAQPAVPAQPAQTAPQEAQPPAQPAQPAQPATPAQPAAEAPKPVAPPPVIEAPAKAPAPAAAKSRTRPVPPVASYKVPTTIPKNGAPYKIRWGDTLWDIAEAFYRNPWQYPRIARFNNIRNPDLIISGTTIRIPPRN